MPSELNVSQSQIAAIFRVTTRTIQRWHDENMPREGEGASTTYDVAECVAWALDRERARLAPDDNEQSYQQSLTRKTIAQAELAEIEVAKSRGSLVALSDVATMLRTPLEQVNAALKNAPTRYAPDLSAAAKGLRIPKAMRILDDIMEKIRADLRAVAENVDDSRSSVA